MLNPTFPQFEEGRHDLAARSEALVQDNRSRSGPAFLRALLAGTAVGIIGLFFVVSPASFSANTETPGPESVVRGDAHPLVDGTPRAARILTLRQGPSEEYEVIGTMGRNAPLEIVGKSSDGAWVAVAVAPAAPLYAWIRVRDIANEPDLSAVPVKPAAIIPGPLTSR